MSGPDIFISYSREERPAARHFAESFAAEGFDVWWDNALRSGETFDEIIERELRAAKAVVVLWSPRSVASRWVRAEATLADRGNKLVPVIIESCDLPIIFELTQAANLANWAGDTSDSRWRRLVADLRRLVGPSKSEAAAEAGEAALAAKPKLAELEPAPVPAAPANQGRANLLAPTPQEVEHTRFFRQSDEFRHQEGEKVHCLLKLDGEDQETLIAVSPSGLKVGRVPPADIIVAGSGVSRAHCLIELAADQLRVTDLNSTNGTYINNKRIKDSEILPVGAVLRIGTVSFEHEVRTRAELKQQFGPTSFNSEVAMPEAKFARH